MIKIGGLEKLTLIDFPGRPAATVFLSGCNFRCPFCYSSELVLPEKIKNHPQIPEKAFFDFLKEREGLLEGIVVCGGEPTIQKELPSFIEKIKKLNYLVKLDTNGSNPKVLRELINKKLIDYVALDIKAAIAKYRKAVGLSGSWNEKIIDNIKESIEFLKNSEIEFEFRTTVVPSLLEKEDIFKIAKWIGSAKRYYLQGFRAEKTIDPYFEKVKPYSKEALLEMKEEISSFFKICEVR